MKTAAAPLIAFLTSAKSCIAFELWTITLQSGAVLRWTDADIDITNSGNTFTRGPVITRSRVTQSRGIEVGSLTCTLESATQLIGSQALPYFAAAGGFEGAAVQLDLVYFDVNMALQGVLSKHFVGTVSDISPTRMGAKLTIKQATSKLSQQTPVDIYQAACPNNLFDSKCGVNRASFTVMGTVSAVGTGINPAITVTFVSSIAASWLDLGIAAITGGANAGIARTVQTQTGTGTSVTLQFARPFPLALAVGDTLGATAGCDKTLTTCGTKFNNLIRYRGTPFIPVVETAAGGG